MDYQNQYGYTFGASAGQGSRPVARDIAHRPVGSGGGRPFGSGAMGPALQPSTSRGMGSFVDPFYGTMHPAPHFLAPSQVRNPSSFGPSNQYGAALHPGPFQGYTAAAQPQKQGQLAYYQQAPQKGSSLLGGPQAVGMAPASTPDVRSGSGLSSWEIHACLRDLTRKYVLEIVEHSRGGRNFGLGDKPDRFVEVSALKVHVYDGHNNPVDPMEVDTTGLRIQVDILDESNRPCSILVCPGSKITSAATLLPSRVSQLGLPIYENLVIKDQRDLVPLPLVDLQSKVGLFALTKGVAIRSPGRYRFSYTLFQDGGEGFEWPLSAPVLSHTFEAQNSRNHGGNQKRLPLSDCLFHQIARKNKQAARKEKRDAMSASGSS